MERKSSAMFVALGKVTRFYSSGNNNKKKKLLVADLMNDLGGVTDYHPSGNTSIAGMCLRTFQTKEHHFVQVVDLQ
ncbi:hypothetical protein C5167_023934 [Papaver somniferum]|uniref:Uncharacterized protein n=1 Tax=Papaver somniferum TaxID=3469 RepID=A0A4Y7JQG1_PAPSO|nr:hypothetical protein C5167_023934 [Papaver somniferum]